MDNLPLKANLPSNAVFVKNNSVEGLKSVFYNSSNPSINEYRRIFKEIILFSNDLWGDAGKDKEVMTEVAILGGVHDEFIFMYQYHIKHLIDLYNFNQELSNKTYSPF